MIERSARVYRTEEEQNRCVEECTRKRATGITTGAVLCEHCNWLLSADLPRLAGTFSRGRVRSAYSRVSPARTRLRGPRVPLPRSRNTTSTARRRYASIRSRSLAVVDRPIRSLAERLISSLALRSVSKPRRVSACFAQRGDRVERGRSGQTTKERRREG